MRVLFDADVLSLLLNPAAEPPIDPTTNKPVERTTERLELLIAELEKAKTRVIVPAPAFAELRVIANESGPDYVAEIDKQAIFSVVPFDGRAAIEAGAATRAAIGKGNKKSAPRATGSASRPTGKSSPSLRHSARSGFTRTITTW